MHAVNLLPKDLAASDRSRVQLPILGAAVVPLIAIGLVVHGYGSARTQVSTAISELSVLNTQVAEIAPARVRAAQEQAVANAATNQLASERSVRLTSLEGALATAPPLDTFLNQVSRVLPTDVWLTTMTASEVGTPAFTISGYARSNQGVVATLARLQLLPSLTAVALTSTSSSTVGTTTVIQFSITATPVPPVVAAPTTPVAVPGATTTTPATTAP